MKRRLLVFGLLVAAIVITWIGSPGAPWASTSLTAMADGGVIGGRPQPGQAPSQAAANARIGFWRPSAFKAQEQNGRPQGLTPAQVKTIFDKLRQISDVFRETPVLKSTVGFELHLFHGVDGLFDPKQNVATAPLPKGRLELSFSGYLQTCATCPIAPEAESSAAIRLWINDLRAFFDRPPFLKVGEDNIYLAPLRIGELAGFPMYQNPGQGPVILLTNDITRPIWVPMSQERYIRAKITSRQASISGVKPPSDQLGRRDIAALEAELAGLSASDRAAPAYVASDAGGNRPSGLCSAGTRGVRELVVINPAFFDHTRPRTSFQVAALETHRPELLLREPPYYVGKKALEAMRTVDWKKIAGLLQ